MLSTLQPQEDIAITATLTDADTQGRGWQRRNDHSHMAVVPGLHRDPGRERGELHAV